jgi:hypothetical protein
LQGRFHLQKPNVPTFAAERLVKTEQVQI